MKHLFLMALMALTCAQQTQANNQLILTNDFIKGAKWGVGIPVAAGIAAGVYTQMGKVKYKPNPLRALICGAPESFCHYTNDNIGFQVSRWTNLFALIGTVGAGLYSLTYLPDFRFGDSYIGLCAALLTTFGVTEVIDTIATPNRLDLVFRALKLLPLEK